MLVKVGEEAKTFKLLKVLKKIISDANPQDEFFSPDEDEGTTIHPLTAAPPECERYPEKNALFSSDNFPSKYNKVKFRLRRAEQL